MFRFGLPGGFFVTSRAVGTEEDGSGLIGALLEVGGRLLGAAYYAGPGTGGYGTVYTATFAGGVQVVQDFMGAPEGNSPAGGLIQGSDGLLYGTAEAAGDVGRGTCSAWTCAGNLMRLHSFDGAIDGGFPQASLVQGSDGNLYGTAGAGRGRPWHGFPMQHLGPLRDAARVLGRRRGFPVGRRRRIHGRQSLRDDVFRGHRQPRHGVPHRRRRRLRDDPRVSRTDGRNPSEADQGADGDLYGTTSGGFLVPSFVYRMNASGTVTPVHSFGDEGNSGNALLLASDGNYWGANGSSVFRIDPNGSFSSCVHSSSGT